MDQAIRNKLRGVVTQCRKLLEDSVAQELQGKFGIYATKKDAIQIDDDKRMSHLDAEERTAREDILDHFEHIKARGFKQKEALDQLVREIAYTHLNRFCAYKMMEARQVYVGDQRFREAVSRGVNSTGVKFYLADHPDDERLYNTGQQDVAYRRFLDWLGGLLSEEIGVLFNPDDSANRLYPTQKIIDEVLALLNDKALAKIWTQDETIGWVYQYFTPKELRDQARKESTAPRNSYELAFRNQFFTPRYVVEFLTDNTLGRIWYEMRKGDTKIKDQCRYMVRRPIEVFLAEGQHLPKEVGDGDDLSQDEDLKQPLHIPHRPKKDPRELKILDPACGSGHFLLYCFDLLLTIYEEAYDDPDLGPALKKDYSSIDELKKIVPGLILSRNLHGIDIDLRATQIAALALWLRSQRAYQEMGLRSHRPKITRSNLVCAEPMPGEKGLLNEFLNTLHEDRLEALIRRVLQTPDASPVRATRSMVERLADLVRLVWDKMQSAGVAGSLLKIEEDLQKAIRKGQEEWEEKLPLFRFTEFSLREQSKESYVRFVPGEELGFWERAESLVMAALHDFAAYGKNGGQLQRRLFAEDAVRGFAFVDICRQRFDVVLMNPPFGSPVSSSALVMDKRAANNLYSAFVIFGLSRTDGFLGAITDRTFIVQQTFEGFRSELVAPSSSIEWLLDLGFDVLDTADVAVAAYVVRRGPSYLHSFKDVRSSDDKALVVAGAVGDLRRWVHLSTTQLRALPNLVFAYGLPEETARLLDGEHHLGKYAILPRGLGSNKADRTYRAWFEIPIGEIGDGRRYRTLCNGGEFSPFFRDDTGVADWQLGSTQLLVNEGYPDGFKAYDQKNTAHYFSAGLSFPKQAMIFNVAVLTADAIPTREGKAIIPGTAINVWSLLAYLNSSVVRNFVSSTTGLHKQSGAIGRIPVPPFSLAVNEQLAHLAFQVVREMLRHAAADETSRRFVVPYHSLLPIGSLMDQLPTDAYDRVDSLLARALNLSQSTVSVLASDRPRLPSSFTASVGDIIAYLIGCILGRWDIRFATGEKLTSELPDAFSPLPICPPGTLHGTYGIPADETPQDYPVRVEWGGILVDDPEHAEDVVGRVREVLEVIWKKRADATEKEACNILGVKELRDYFRKLGKGGFWDHHVFRYSKSRRKAPIYWLLQSSRKNYAVWLYYHRLDKDLLFKALVNYVEPKIQRETNRLDEMRREKQAAGESGKGAKKLDKDIEHQEDLISELRDFEDKLRRAAKLHLEPDLNDGVVLNIAPLHELVPWKEAKNYWDELLEGKYEWSSIGKQLRQKGVVK